MDLNIIRGVLLVMLIIAFLGMWVWAWSSKRALEFEQAAQLPLEEDNGVIPGTDGDGEKPC